MKNIKISGLVLMIIGCNSLNVMSQGSKIIKPSLAIEDLEKWTSIQWPSEISNDGKYVFYSVENENHAHQALHVCNVAKSWEKVIAGGQRAEFSSDSKFMSVLDSTNQLLIISLGKEKIEKIQGATLPNFLKIGATEWLVYLAKQNNELHLQNLNNAKELVYRNVKTYRLNNTKDKMVLIDRIDENKEEVSLLNLKTNQVDKFWKGGQLFNITFNKRADRLLFFGSKEPKGEITQTDLWEYNIQTGKLEELLGNRDLFKWKNYSISSIDAMTENNEYVFLSLRRLPMQLSTGVDVYSYLDTVPMSQQLVTEIQDEELIVMVDRGKREAIRITDADEGFQLLDNELGLIDQKTSTRIKSARLASGYLYNFKTRNRRLLPLPLVMGQTNRYAGGKKIILQPSWRNNEKDENLYSCDIYSGITTCLTDKIPKAKFPNEIKFQRRFRVLAYLEGTNDAIVSDFYDLWQIDLDGKRPPLNVTNGFGEANEIGFEIAQLNFKDNSKVIPVSNQADLILTSFDYINKNNDYYRISLGGRINNPFRLTSGGYAYETTLLKGLVIEGTFAMKKAKEDETYLFSRQNAGHSLNLFITKNFKNVKQISYVAPEANFNWLTSELIKFKGEDGKFLSGILYKPENFDDKKKYPVIITYYMYRSQDLNCYYVPELQSGAEPNIPFFVSNNYLIFVPDIPIKLNLSYTSAMNSVIGAYNFLADKPYVEKTKIGLAGHSHGGAQTNFVVTHSGKFAAAVSGSGYSDQVGIYGFDPLDQSGLQTYIQGSIFTDLPDYVKYSSKLSADKLTTPLLLIHNKMDKTVPFLQSLSFFNTLWGLGKRAWLLQYDDEGHAVWRDSNKLDFTTRVKQFFDHYLKGVPAPVWMTHGVPFKEKGYEDGLEYDNEIKTPVLP